MSFLNKCLSLLLTVVLLLVAIPYQIGTKVDAATVTVMHIQGENVRIRETASAKNNDNIIDKVSHITANVIEKKEISQTEVWYKISYTNSSGNTVSGYVFYDDDYISILTYNPDASFEEKIKAFPESYRDALRTLHTQYPKWEFIPDDVGVNFSDAVAVQLEDMNKQVNLNSSLHPASWRSMNEDSYDWSKKTWKTTNGGWTGASREAVAYYMDPRNFLNDSEIYMFLQQSYNSSVQTEENTLKIIQNTFLAKNYTVASGEPCGGSYLKVIMEAAKESGVNPYIIASKIIQEQGSSGSTALISGTYSGYEGYYNFFNFGASGSDNTAVITNGLKKAVSYGWNSRYKSIVGGAKLLSENYIARGQDTYYYQDFNVRENGKHQYAQAVFDAYSKGISLSKTYKSQFSMSLSFKIPVFKNMPEVKSPIPVSNSKKNNYYFSEITVNGLSPSFNMFTTNYSLSVSGDTAIKVNTVGDGATNESKVKYTLKEGTNKVALTVKSQTGYLNDYIITITASKSCYLYVNSSGTIPENADSIPSYDPSTDQGNSSGDKVIIGDTNSDGKITIVDLAKVQMHILKKKLLTDNSLKAGDINSDGKITILDLARIQMHILGVKLIES